MKILTEEEKIGALRKILENIIARKHPYAQKMSDAGIRPDHIQTRKDLALLPFTTKKDLIEHYPLGWLACDRNELIRFHATSGTTDNPAIVAYTAEDLRNWTQSVSWCLSLAKLGKNDTLQVAYSYGLFTGAFGFHYGAENQEITVLPTAGGFTDRQIKLMCDLESTALTCTPSYALRLAEALEKKGNPTTKLKVGIFGAEAWSEELRRELERKLKIKALDMYGLSEAMGPGVAMECLEQNGLHISDLFLPEIIDPQTMTPLEEGKNGELVLTSWAKQAFPVIRYRTRDLTHILPKLCACCESGPRIARIQGRSDDMLIVHGVNIFPSMIEAALCKIPGLTPNYRVEVGQKDGVQDIAVFCERQPNENSHTDTILRIGSKVLRDALGVNIPLHILAPDTLPRSEGKAKHIIFV